MSLRTKRRTSSTVWSSTHAWDLAAFASWMRLRSGSSGRTAWFSRFPPRTWSACRSRSPTRQSWRATAQRTQRASSSTSSGAHGRSSPVRADVAAMAGPQAISFLTVERGTAVVDRFDEDVGTLERVLLLEDDGFDGIVVKTGAGTRFVDAPEVRRISRGAVALGVTRADVENPGADCNRVYGIPEARHGRLHATEADRDEAI